MKAAPAAMARPAAPAAAAQMASAHPALLVLQAQHAHRLDPVRWRYLQALAQRSALHRGEVRALLETRLAGAVAAYTQAFEAARSAAQQRCKTLCQHFPQAAEQANQYCDAGDFSGLNQLADALHRAAHGQPLTELLHHIEKHTAALDTSDERTAQAAGRLQGQSSAATAAHPVSEARELRALHRFKDTWARLSVDQQLARSLAQVPANPGPLNSHLLVLRSLRLMQDTAPAYLAHFLSYAKTLLWLEQTAAASAVLPAQPPPARRMAGDARPELLTELQSDRKRAPVRKARKV